MRVACLVAVLSGVALLFGCGDKEQTAVATIEELGGEVTFDEESLERPVAKVILSGAEVTDIGLENVKGLTSVRTLLLNNTQITDAGLEHLNVLTNLQTLDVSGGLFGRPQVTDAGLEHLRGLTQLRQLNLDDTQVTNEGVEKLKKSLPNCEISHR